MRIMSVDVESWVHRPVFNIPLSEQTKELDAGHVLRSTRIVLERFRAHGTKATFFVLGTVAEWYPELIDLIKNDGHEIGIHGYTHTRLCNHTRDSFKAEIKKTISLLNGLGVTPRGYRAPAFSSADFLYEVLREHGIIYDSSIIPVKTPLYDGTAYDCRPFVTDNGIVEIPCSVFKVAKLRLPVGGFYLRLLGGRMNYVLLRAIERRVGIAVMYLHPWELLEMAQSVTAAKKLPANLPFLKRRFAHYKIPMTMKFDYVLDKLRFTSIEGAMSDITALLS